MDYVKRLSKINEIDRSFNQYVNELNNSNEKINSEEMKIYVQINRLLIDANKCILNQIENNGEN